MAKKSAEKNVVQKKKTTPKRRKAVQVRTPKVSVVCPFYNEEAILEGSVDLMIKNLERLEDDWELIIVNDGSTDGSGEIAAKLAKQYKDKVILCDYTFNRGRGYAIRAGARAAKGQYLITTEIDSSWGDDIVSRLVTYMKENPMVDIVIASPHLPGGGYQDVPAKRVFLSSFGNTLLRLALFRGITMYTGMTRGYKKEKFLVLPLEEDEKEQHLEIARKALAFQYVIGEIPAVLSWKHNKLEKPNTKGKWKSSAKIVKLVRTHLWFSLMAAPFRYLIAFGGIVGLLSVLFMVVAIVNLFTSLPSVYFLLTSLSLLVLSFLMLGIAILSRQTIETLHETWRLRRDHRRENLIARGDIAEDN